MRKKMIKYACAVGAGLLIALLVAVARGAFTQTDVQMQWQYLSDAFFVAAVVLLSAGLLTFVASDGLFDMIGFGVKKLFSIVQRENSRSKGTFFDYIQMSRAHRGGGYGFIIVTGVLFMAVAAVFLMLYTQAGI